MTAVKGRTPAACDRRGRPPGHVSPVRRRIYYQVRVGAPRTGLSTDGAHAVKPTHDWRFPFVTVGKAKGKRAAGGGFAVTIETDYGEFASSSYSAHDIAELESVVAAVKAGPRRGACIRLAGDAGATPQGPRAATRRAAASRVTRWVDLGARR